MRLRAKEPIVANPSARQALTASSVSNTCLAHTKQLGNVDLRQNASDRITFLAKRASEPRTARCGVDDESVLGRETLAQRPRGTALCTGNFNGSDAASTFPLGSATIAKRTLSPA